MDKKILVTPRSFGSGGPAAKNILDRENFQVVYNNTGHHYTEKEMIDKSKAAAGIIVGTDPVTKRVIEEATNLEVISKYGVGLDNIDIAAANEEGIMVTYTPGTNTEAVAELSIGLALDLARGISAVDKQVKKRQWEQKRGMELQGKLIGIIGTGRIGKRVAEIANCFKMEVKCYDIDEKEEWANKIGAEYCSLKELIASSDIISLHVPLNSNTKDLIDKKELDMMKESSILINTARGGIVNEKELIKALKKDKIGGAGLDVFTEQPPQYEEFYDLDNIIMTSHIASHTVESINKMGIFAAQNLIKGLNGEVPEAIVNPEFTENC